MSRFLLALLAAAIVSCERPPARFERSLYTFGTDVRIELRGLDADRAMELLDRLERQLLRWNHDWYAWGDGALGTLNGSLANATEATTTREIGQQLERAAALRTLSGGLFDPTIGALVSLWQFDGRHDVTTTLPSKDAIEAAATHASYSIELLPTYARVRVERPGITFDLGGLAKGFALAEVRQQLRAAAVPRSDCRYRRRRFGYRPWRHGAHASRPA